MNSSNLLLGTASDDSHQDFSGSDGDGNYRPDDDLSSSSSIVTTKTPSKKRATRTTSTSNHSFQRNFDALGLNSPGTSAHDTIGNNGNYDLPEEEEAAISEANEQLDNFLGNQADAQFGDDVANRGNLNGRLTAPPNEIRRRNRQKSKQNGETIDTLRKKQDQLLDLQIDLHKILIENAKITREECTEKLLLAEALRKNAEANMNSNRANE